MCKVTNKRIQYKINQSLFLLLSESNFGEAKVIIFLPTDVYTLTYFYYFCIENKNKQPWTSFKY